MISVCPPPAGRREKPASCFSTEVQRDGGINYGVWAKWTRRSETCVTGMILSILSYFEYEDAHLDTLAGHLMEQQMPDGGWNCRRPDGATHASVHSTISVLEGLRHYELYRGRQLQAVRGAQRRGREFLLLHRLFRSHRTGEIIKPAFIRFSFPPRWRYDILRALDYFQAVHAPRDPRLDEAIDMSAAASAETGVGRCNTRTTGRRISSLSASARPAVGILCARCVSLSGGIGGAWQEQSGERTVQN